jgi:hypothetical protein
MLHRPWKPLVTLLGLSILYRHAILLSLPENLGSPYDNFARQYATILARHDVRLDVRNTLTTVENLDLLRDATSGVQAALTTSASHGRRMLRRFTHSAGYMTQRYSSSIAAPSPSRSFRNFVASELPLDHPGAPCTP